MDKMYLTLLTIQWIHTQYMFLYFLEKICIITLLEYFASFKGTQIDTNWYTRTSVYVLDRISKREVSNKRHFSFLFSVLGTLIFVRRHFYLAWITWFTFPLKNNVHEFMFCIFFNYWIQFYYFHHLSLSH